MSLPLCFFKYIVVEVIRFNPTYHIICYGATTVACSLTNTAECLQDNNENNDTAALNNIEAFVSKIRAQSSKEINIEDADQIISKAQEIIELIGGGE